MITGLSMNTMSMLGTQSTQRQPPPPDKDVFKVADSNKDGQVSETELQTLAAGIEEITGDSVDVEDALATYDTDQSGSLSGQELFDLLSDQGFNPGGVSGGEPGAGGMRSPPPPPEQVLSAYGEDSSDDSISQLIEYLKSQSESDEVYSALELKA